MAKAKAPPIPLVEPTAVTEENAPRIMLGMPGCEKCDGYGDGQCPVCDGDGTTSCGNSCCDLSHECRACKGSGDGPCGCHSDPKSGRAILAAEATRLWKRDVGRGVLTGTAATYIAFAVKAANDGELAVSREGWVAVPLWSASR